MTAPPHFLGLTRWEFIKDGLRFRIWTRPIVGGHGGRIVPVTLVWSDETGVAGVACCSGFIEAIERAGQVAEQRGISRQAE